MTHGLIRRYATKRALALIVSTAVTLAGLSFAAPAAFADEATIVSGTVRASDGTALANASVRAESLVDGYVRNSIASTASAEDGTFSLGIDFATNPLVRVTITAPYSGDDADTVFDITSSNYSTPNWTLKEANIFGLVLDAGSPVTPLANASIALYSYDGSRRTGSLLNASAQDSNGVTGLFKAYNDFAVNSEVELTVGPPWGGSSNGAESTFILTGGTGSRAEPTQFSLSSVNVSGIARDSDNSLLLGAQVDVQAFDDNGNATNSIAYTQTDMTTGAFQLSVDFDAYARVLFSITPGRSDIGAKTWWVLTREEAAAGTGYVGVDRAVEAPNISGTVRDADGAVLAGASVQLNVVDDSNNYLRNIGATSAYDDGTVRLYIDFTETPRARLTVGPPWNGSAVGAATDFYLTGTATSQTWTLVAPNVTGTVRDVGGAVLPNASIQLQEVDSIGNYISWIGSSMASSSGAVSVNVDFSAYAYVKMTVGPPWDGSAVGAATDYILSRSEHNDNPSVYLNQTWSLSAPNVSGTVFDSDGSTPLANAQVNIQQLDANGFMGPYITGGLADDSGNFGFAVSQALLDAGGNGVVVQVTPPSDYSGRGTTTTLNLIPTLSTAVTATGLSIPLDSSNAVVRVVDGAGTPLANSWVFVRAFDAFNGVQGSTNSQGLAFFALEAADQTEILDTEYSVNAEAPWDRRSDFSSSQINGFFTLDPSSGLPALQVTLNEPNVKLSVTDGSNPIRWGGIEVRASDDPFDFQWANTDASGRANLTLEDGSYELTVRPPSWGADGAPVLADKTYTLTLASGEVTSFSDSAGPITAVGGRYPLTAGTPNFPIKVVNSSDAPVGGGWVEVVNTGSGQWLNGAQVRGDGLAGLSLTDGTYRITVNAPWGSATYSNAAPCEVTIASSAVSATTCGSPVAGNYVFTLRSPNFVMQVIEPTGSDPVPYSHVCVVNDDTWSCASANATGTAALFVDTAASGDSFDYQVMPPWGSSGYAPATGTVLDSDIGDWAAAQDKQVRLNAPNLRVSVTAGGAAVRDGWVTVFERTGSDWRFVAGGSTGRDGTATMSVDTVADPNYCLQIYPGYSLASEYGQFEDCTNALNGTGDGTTDSPRVVNVALQSANVRTFVLSSDGTANKWGYVRVEQGGEEITGTGLNENGRLALYLEPGTYDLTFYPGPAGKGAPVTQTVVVTASGSDLPASVSLAAGNISGSVTRGGSALAGALVTATSGSLEASAVSAPDGSFTLSLPNGTWDVSVFPPPGSSGSAPEQSVTVSGGTAAPSTLTFAVS